METKFILASGSPRRREIFESMGIEYEIITTDAEENVDITNMTPEQTVLELAMAKGKAVADTALLNGENINIIVSADTVVVDTGKILGKPQDREEAKKMLKSLSGGKHSVLTGLCVLKLHPETGIESFAVSVSTDVYFKTLTEQMIEAYLDTGEYADKAGSYGIQEKGALLVEKIDGDYFNVVGFPLNRFYELLRDECKTDLFCFAGTRETQTSLSYKGG